MIYEFEGCTLDTSTQELRRDDELVAVEPQVFAVLEHLLANPGRVVSKIELLDEVWGDRFVSESALTSRIKLARQACGDSGRAQRIIRTVHGRGYRMVAPITERGAVLAVAPTGPRGPSAVGREVEIARLGATADATADGARSTVFVTGPAGVGKSTVVAEFLEQIDDLDQWLVLRGRCHRSRSGSEPYFALLDAFGSLAAEQPDLVRDVLDRVAPSWLVQLPSLVDDETAARLERRLLGGARQRMLREGADGLAALARRRRTILVLEDLHQADDCTLDLLELVSGRLDPIPLMIVATARPGTAQVDALVTEARTAAAADEIALGPLDRDAIGKLIADRHPDLSVDPTLVELVHDRCDGNPLFAREILTAWDVAGLMTDVDGVLTTDAGLDEVTATIPPGLVPLIERTLDGLDGDELEVLEAAAAAGVGFDAASVAAGLDRPLTETETVLARMARRPDHIDAVGATSWTDGTVSTAYRFVHQMHRDVIHDRTARPRRVELHRRIGLALEEGHRSSIDSVAATLADHFVVADDTARAARYLRRVGTQAMARQAHGRAVDVLCQALEQCERLTPGPERDALELDVRLSLGQALVGSVGWFDEDVGRHYERALALAGQLGAADEEAHARYALATISEMQGDFERTEHLLVPVLASGEGELEVEAHELVACSTFHQGAFERSEESSGAVLSTCPEDASSELMARVAEHPATSCNSWMSLTNWFLGRSDDSLRRAETAVRLGQRHRYALAMATQQRAMLHQLRDEPEECLEWADRTLALERPLLSRVRRLQSEILRSWALAVVDAAHHEPARGDAVTAMDQAVQRFRDAGVRLDVPYYLALHADVLVRHGRPADALVLLEESEARIDASTRTYFHRPEIRRLRARALVLLDEPGAGDRARAELDEGLELARAMGSPAMVLRITRDRLELELDGGDPAPWRDRLAELTARYDGQVAPPDVVRAQALLAG